MLSVPPVSSWEALHPSISHFPIVLLIVGPLFVLLGLWLRDHRRVLTAVAVGLMVAGTLGVYLSASTGDEAKKAAPQTPEVKQAVETHENLGSVARAVFTVLTLLLAALQYGPGLLRKELGTRAYTTLAVLFLLLCAGGALVLLNTAHTGGLLVHKLGVHAKI
jgi:uncharacterized membrane protein